MSEIKPVAYFRCDFPTKFGLPRQSGLVGSLIGKIVFEPEFHNPDALREIEGFSHLWLIWEFSAADNGSHSLTVRPPRLGGNRRVGVFATRSPFRPNRLGLSCVKLEKAVFEGDGAPYLLVSGADLMDKTPIYDIKPYLPYVDCKPDAIGGFSEDYRDYRLEVTFPEELLRLIPQEKRETLIGVLSNDPRPAYQNDPERLYGFEFAGFEIRFSVDSGALTVREIEKK